MFGWRWAWLVALTALACGGVAPVTPVESRVDQSVRMQGQLTTAGLDLSVNGKPTLVPEADLILQVPDGLQVAGTGEVVAVLPPPEPGYDQDRLRWIPAIELPPPVQPAGWQLSIFEVGDDGRPTPFYTLRERGAPVVVDWDGVGDDGRAVVAGGLYVAQLYVVGGAREAAAASAFVPFIIAAAPEPSPRQHVLSGTLFRGGKAPKIMPKVAAQLSEVAATIGPGSEVEVAVHGDGDLSKSVATWARTMREAKLIEEHLIEAGVPATKITAKGFGSSAPLVPPTSAKNRNKNQRIEITIVPPRPRPVAPTVARDRLPGSLRVVQIDGREVRLEGGAFDERRFQVDPGGFLIHAEMSDGRMTTIVATPGRGPSAAAGAGPARVSSVGR